MTLKHINTGKHVNTTSICAQDIIMQWVYCNVYATDKRSVEHKIENLLKTVAQLNKFGDRKSDNYWSICTQFLEKQNSLFVIVTDADRKKSQAKLWGGGGGVTFDDAFFKNQQKNPPDGYCSTAVDRAWAIQNERKQKRQNRVRSEHYQFERANYDHLDEPSSSSIDVDQDLQNADADWVDDSTEELPPASRKRRIQVNQGDAKNNQELPENYRHIRNSIHNVQPQFYTAIDRMISELHMSKSQAVGASIIIAKEMFNLTWKTSDEDENVIDLDTVPHNFCLRKEGKAREVLALKLIVDKIIESSDKSTITFHDDGSRKQGAGKFSVQGVSIDGKHYHFPTLSLAQETRENLADMKVLVLQLLSTASGVNSDILWGKIHFSMTDSTSHNMEVDEKVAEKLGSDHVPGHLLCHVHPACMFTRRVQELCKEVDATIGPDKIFSSFAVSLSEVQVSVVEQWMDCLTRLVTHDFDHKAWNYADEFDIFILPLKNLAKRLQRERFNSFVYTAAVVLWLDKHVSNFLSRFTNITNNLACIVRSFENLEYIRVMAAVIVVIGVHLLEPYLSLTTSSNTNYAKLCEAFPKLHNDLVSANPADLLDLSKPAFSFVSKERFDNCVYDTSLLQPTLDVISEFSEEVIEFLRILLPKLAQGWDLQRGTIFDFGSGKGVESDLKINNLDQEKLKTAPIHNLSSERAVGSVNYGLKIYGSKQLKLVGSSLVKAGAAELMVGKEVTPEMRKLVSKDGEIPQILSKWEEKQKQLQKKGMDDKDLANVAVDKQRNADLEKLVKLGGPFTSSDAVRKYLDNDSIDEKDKNQRMYIEIRYAKNTSLSFPKCSEIFKLKKKYKNLSTKEYCVNLMTYLDKVTCNVNMDFSDFKNALNRLKSQGTDNNE